MSWELAALPRTYIERPMQAWLTSMFVVHGKAKRRENTPPALPYAYTERLRERSRLDNRIDIKLDRVLRGGTEVLGGCNVACRGRSERWA